MKFGYTFEYFIHALLLIFLGIVSVFVHYTISVFLFVIALLLLLIKKGITLDSTNNRVRNYTELLGLRFGKWIEIHGLQSVDLKYSSISQTLNSRVHSNTFHTKTFDLYLTFKDQQAIEIASFTDYKIASKVLSELSQELNVNSNDSIKEMRKQAFENRSNRRR